MGEIKNHQNRELILVFDLKIKISKRFPEQFYHFQIAISAEFEYGLSITWFRHFAHLCIRGSPMSKKLQTIVFKNYIRIWCAQKFHTDAPTFFLRIRGQIISMPINDIDNLTKYQHPKLVKFFSVKAVE